MITFNLKKEWYERVRSGEKEVEFREVKPYWTKRLRNELLKNYGSLEDEDLIELVQRFDTKKSVLFPFIPCEFRLGYSGDRILGSVNFIKIVDGNDTPLAVDKPVYALGFSLRKGE